MTTAYWCVLAAALMPYVAVSIAKSGGERFDNSNPRLWLERQQGFRARANAAQANSFEAFPFFAAAVIVAHLTQAPQDRIDALAVMFVARARRVHRLLRRRLALGTVDRVDHRSRRDDHDLRLGSLRWPDRSTGRCTASRCSNWER